MRMLTRDMTVLCGDGLVGVVKEVYATTSLVMLESDPSFRVGVRIAGSQEIGILSGQGTDRADACRCSTARSTVKTGDVLLARGSEGRKTLCSWRPRRNRNFRAKFSRVGLTISGSPIFHTSA